MHTCIHPSPLLEWNPHIEPKTKTRMGSVSEGEPLKQTLPSRGVTRPPLYARRCARAMPAAAPAAHHEELSKVLAGAPSPKNPHSRIMGTYSNWAHEQGNVLQLISQSPNLSYGLGFRSLMILQVKPEAPNQTRSQNLSG